MSRSAELELLIIANKPEEALRWERAGVDIIFIDLEREGKAERQKGMNTVMSDHTVTDVSLVRAVLTKSQLLVRLNPLGPNTADEVDDVIDRGADTLMLPMFSSAEEVAELLEFVAGRAQVYPLIETRSALLDIEKLLLLDGVEGYHFGLNDLHLDLELNFMFEVMLSDEFEVATRRLREERIKFGVGGVAALGDGMLPAELIIAEHRRIGSTRAILSRGFKAATATDSRSDRQKVNELKRYYSFGERDLVQARQQFSSIVRRIANEAASK